ncbi:unnamed protein product [Rangifer tarandus platyrhynchus]|uniref:Uncharacterized protein n=2 Tax=Rangifer tarandus platyrhynchus TaxID=3082113 RepID=A0ACB0FLX5_RANTA|nr:unnamed protein product [Rangifer tarandus platyrhynchus]CAI9713773.1 unnamed protein product [Rangifer tarandus platyrhynchus]
MKYLLIFLIEHSSFGLCLAFPHEYILTIFLVRIRYDRAFSSASSDKVKNHFTGKDSRQASEHVHMCTPAARRPRRVPFSQKHWGQHFRSGAWQDAYVTITCQKPLTYSLCLDNHTTLTGTIMRPRNTQCSFVRTFQKHHLQNGRGSRRDHVLSEFPKGKAVLRLKAKEWAAEDEMGG